MIYGEASSYRVTRPDGTFVFVNHRDIYKVCINADQKGIGLHVGHDSTTDTVSAVRDLWLACCAVIYWLRG